MSHRMRTAWLAIGASLLAPAVLAADATGATVDFSPAVMQRLHQQFGAKEADVLRAAILAALWKRERREPVPDGLTLKVTVRSVLPTHPTMQQQLDDPALSPVRTRYLGGAALLGEVLDSTQQVLATVKYSNFADVLPAGSPSLDPWADARQSINAFAAKFAASWDKLPRNKG